MTRTRVLRVIARMNVGGPAWQVTALTERLDRAEFETRLLVGQIDEGEQDYLELRASDLPVTRIDGLSRSIRPGDDVRALRSVVREIRRFRPEIVHTHTAKAGVLGRVAATACRVPFRVHTFHGHLLHGYFSPAKTATVVQAERALARASTRLVAVGSRVRDDLLDAGIGRAEQYDVVPPGIEIPPPGDRAASRERLGLDVPGAIVLLVARLTTIKRPERFVRVAAIVGERFPDATFVVAGEGPLLPEMQALAAPLGTRVRFLGYRTDVETLYAAADVVVLTSDNEGMPVSLIEAAGVGRPVVATDVGSTAEVVVDGETGLLVPTDVAAVAAAVERLLGDEELRRRMGESARVHATRHFAVERLVDDTEQLYRRLRSPTTLGTRRMR